MICCVMVFSLCTHVSFFSANPVLCSYSVFVRACVRAYVRAYVRTSVRYSVVCSSKCTVEECWNQLPSSIMSSAKE